MFSWIALWFGGAALIFAIGRLSAEGRAPAWWQQFAIFCLLLSWPVLLPMVLYERARVQLGLWRWRRQLIKEGRQQ